MKIDVRVQVFAVKCVDRVGVLRTDVTESDVFADDRAVLASTNPLSPDCRARDLVCSMNNFPNSLATV